MKISIYKHKLNNYFEQFVVSPKMAAAWKVVLGCPFLKDIYVDFKLSSIGYKEKCTVDVIEEKSGQFKKYNMLVIAELFLPHKSFLKFSKIVKFANLKKIRIGYSIRDEIPLILKLYFHFDNGLVFENEIRQLIKELGFDFSFKLPDHKGLTLGFEFQEETIALSIYEYYHGLPRDYLKKNCIKNYLKGMHYNKSSYYACAKKYSLKGKLIYSKIAKIYNRNHRFIQIKKDAKLAMGREIYMDINKNFKDFTIDNLALRLEDGRRDVYIFPRGCSCREFM